MEQTKPLLEKILELAGRMEASDVYLDANEYPCYQIQDELREFPNDTPKLTPDQMKAIVEELVARPIQKEMFERDQILEFSHIISPRGLERDGYWQGGRYRFTLEMQRGHYSISIRRLHNEVPSFEQLNLPTAIQDFCSFPQGLVVICGPTDAGKSTTMAAMIDHINRNFAKTITIVEEPREFFFRNHKSKVRQKEIGKDVPSYKIAGRGASRNNTRVLVFGETTEPETVRALIKAANSALTFTTVHASSASMAINAMINMLPDEIREDSRLQVSRLLRGVIYQTLVKTYDDTLYPCLEIVGNNSTIRSLILNKERGEDGKSYTIDDYVARHGRSEGMQTLDQALRDLYNQGIIADDEAIEKARNRRDMELALKQGHFGGIVDQESDASAFFEIAPKKV